ncbi:hypothetical protein ACFSFW_18610 [Fredinandcohnia salidurans]|uniref:DUF3726 domain-containing protein n=1 Tax=Fredinandcohnia salidurans TaxID=2595041 RepID=A0ABW4MSS3_9BACI|nr:hypothetical protein [Fredinandcohnia onubensis]
MRVSYVELFQHCKKVFCAGGTPYGCADDGAEVVTWSEFIGLEGMHVLQQEILDNPHSLMEGIELVSEENGLYRFDGNGQSAIILGKMMADYALSLSETNKTVRVYMHNTTRSRLLAKPAHDIATRNRGCIIRYKTMEGNPMWILSTPGMTFPLLVEGEVAERILQQNLTAELGKYETTNLASDGFWLVCTTEIELITSCIRELRQEASKGTITLTESTYLKANFEKAYHNGAKVDPILWNSLNEIGRQTLVTATELSRLRGAGELAT